MNTILSTRQMLLDAQAQHYAVPAFNIHNMETLQVVVEVAEKMHSPVILAGTPSTIRYAGPAYIVAMAQVAAKQTTIPSQRTSRFPSPTPSSTTSRTTPRPTTRAST